MINIVGSSRYKVNKKILKSFVVSLFEKNNINPEAIINIAFVGTRKMRDIASTYKDENVALPVLAFPYNDTAGSEGGQLLGEICICYPQAVLLAAERGKKVEDMMQQLIEHGLRNILNSKA